MPAREIGVEGLTDNHGTRSTGVLPVPSPFECLSLLISQERPLVSDQVTKLSRRLDKSGERLWLQFPGCQVLLVDDDAAQQWPTFVVGEFAKISEMSRHRSSSGVPRYAAVLGHFAVANIPALGRSYADSLIRLPETQTCTLTTLPLL